MPDSQHPHVATHVRVAVAASAFGGLGTAIRLTQSGIDDVRVFERSNDDVRVFERSNDVGGVRRDNTDPSCACDVDAKTKGTVWMSGGCTSWYLDARGNDSTLWPGFTFTFKRRVEPFDPSEYVVMPRSSRTSVAPDKAPRVNVNGSGRLEAARG